MVTFRFWAFMPLLAPVLAANVAEEDHSSLLTTLIKESGLDLSNPDVLEAMALAEAYEARQQPPIDSDTRIPRPPTPAAVGDKGSRSRMSFRNMVRRSGWFGRLVKKATLHFKDKCLRLKKEGIIPEAEHSPLKKFGHVRFDPETRKLSIFPGWMLTKMDSWMIPIRVGSQDYTMQGDSASVLLFLECFSDYEVLGARLTEDGHWDEQEQTHSPLFLQVENVGPVAFGSIKYMMYTHSVEQLLKSIDPLNVFTSAIGSYLQGIQLTHPTVKKALLVVAAKWLWIRHLYQLAGVLNLSKEEVLLVWNYLADQKSFSSRAKRFTQLLRKSRKDLVKHQWSGYHNVKMAMPVSVTITMYPKPEHGIRATYALNSNRVKVADLFDAFSRLLTKTGIAEKLPDSDDILLD